MVLTYSGCWQTSFSAHSNPATDSDLLHHVSDAEEEKLQLVVTDYILLEQMWLRTSILIVKFRLQNHYIKEMVPWHSLWLKNLNSRKISWKVWFEYQGPGWCNSGISCEVVQILIRRSFVPLSLSCNFSFTCCEGYSLSQLDWVTECPILGQTFFWMCLCGCFWMRLTFEPIDGGKQIALPNVGGPRPISWRPE